MRNLIAVVTVLTLALSLLPSSAHARIPDQYTDVRTTAVLTASDVLSTTFTIPNNVKAVHFYIDFTKGSLTSADFSPAAALSGNPAAASYYKSVDFATNLTADVKAHIRVPAERFGAARYAGIFVKGNGTATGSKAPIAAKYEY